MTEQFPYSNLTGRPPGRFVSIAAKVLPGVRRVQDQVVPYADYWRARNAEEYAAGGPLWVALGDSMTQGIGASAPEHGWVGQLYERLAAAGTPYRLVNLSASGARTDDLLDSQLPALRALDAEPDLVTALVGSNDLMSGERRDALPERFGELLDGLPKGAVVGTLPNPRAAAVAVNALIAAGVRDGRLVAAELRTDVSWRGRLADDHFHPNDLGYAGMADVFERAVTSR